MSTDIVLSQLAEPTRLTQEDTPLVIKGSKLPPLKEAIFSIEAPMFSVGQTLKKRIHYKKTGRNGEVYEFVMVPSDIGLPTMDDNDLLVFIRSHYRQSYCTLEEYLTHRHVIVTLKDYAKATGRKSNGRLPQDFLESLQRLKRSSYLTNARNNDGDSLIHEYSYIVNYTIVSTARNQELPSVVRIEVSEEFLRDAFSNRAILTFNKDYFLLRSDYRKRLYAIARKSCGRNFWWQFSLDKLYDMVIPHDEAEPKDLIYFRKLLLRIIQAEPVQLLDYEITFNEKTKNVVFFNHKDFVFLKELQKQKLTEMYFSLSRYKNEVEKMQEVRQKQRNLF